MNEIVQRRFPLSETHCQSFELPIRLYRLYTGQRSQATAVFSKVNVIPSILFTLMLTVSGSTAAHAM